MDWNVKNAVNRDVERQHLNKILKEIRGAVDELQTSIAAEGGLEDDVRQVVAGLVENNTEHGITVIYNSDGEVLDFIVNDFTIRLSGDVTGEADVVGLRDVNITATIDPALIGVPEAPIDGFPYWRYGGEWQQVTGGLYQLEELITNGFAVKVYDSGGGEHNWVIRQINVNVGELTVDDGDGVSGNPTLGLADVTPAVGGTMKTLLFDDKGRRIEEDEATTDDLPEGVVNLYFTGERAQDAVGTILGTTDDVALAYNDATPEITATLPSKGQPDGLATLDGSGKLVATQLPALAITDTFVVADEPAMLALAAEQGDVAVRTDEQKSYILTAAPASTLANWQELLTPTGTGGTVTSVDSGTGLTGGPITSTGTLSLDSASIASLALADSSVQPGDNVSTLTNDAGYTTNNGTVTSVNLGASTGLTPSGGPVTGSGTLTYTLSANLQAWHALATSAKLNTPTGTANDTTFSRGDGVWSNTLTNFFQSNGSSAGYAFQDRTTSANWALYASGGQALLFTGSDNMFGWNVDGRMYGFALHNNAGSVSGTSRQYIASGTYSPTLTNVTNIATSTSDVCSWIRVGNVVTVSGVILIDPSTANTASTLGISLPIASNITGFSDCGGVGAMAPTSTGGISGAIAGNAANDRADLFFCTTTETGPRSWGIHFTYVVK